MTDELDVLVLDPSGRRLAPDRELPAWMHPLVSSVDGRRLPERYDPGAVPPTARRSAVLILLGEGDAGPDMLLTARATTMRSHAGQPAFPGGASDPGEDAVTTALREGAEETGLDPRSVTPAALLPHLFLPPSGYVVQPVIGHWRSPGAVRAVDPAETSAVARVPLRDLIDPAHRGQVAHPSGYVGPAFEVADMLVWGFTAGLVDMVLELGGWAVPWDADRRLPLPALDRP